MRSRGAPLAQRPAAWSRTRRVLCAGLVLATAAALGPPYARLYLSRDEALVLAFGETAVVDRATVFLTEAQLSAARRLAGAEVEIESALVTRYVGQVDDEVVGTAYFDTHRVRTLQETVMIVVTPDATVGRIEILSFGEPVEYVPKRGWLDQFPGRELGRDLSLKREIHGITGATLSARAVTDATRRVLAIHGAIQGAPATGATP